MQGSMHLVVLLLLAAVRTLSGVDYRKIPEEQNKMLETMSLVDRQNLTSSCLQAPCPP